MQDQLSTTVRNITHTEDKVSIVALGRQFSCLEGMSDSVTTGTCLVDLNCNVAIQRHLLVLY